MSGDATSTTIPNGNGLRLQELASNIAGIAIAARGEGEIQRVVHDSRRVQPGDLFVAIRGVNTSGSRFIPEALSRGASAVAAETADAPPTADLPSGVGLMVVPDARRALGHLSSAIWDHPSEKLRLVGVTGTDGKTTTSQLIGRVLATTGRRVGWITTSEIRAGNVSSPSDFAFTTPEAPELQETLARFVNDGVEDAIIEVSSHALVQERVAGCTFDAAVFTNLTPEHLNFHGSMERYAAAKARLFEMLDTPTTKRWSRMGIVNIDDPASVTMAVSSPAPIVSYAIDTPADVRGVDLRLGASGTRFGIVTPIDEVVVETLLVGRHNVYNWLAAAAVALGWGIDMAAVVAAATETEPPTGRLQRVDGGQPFDVFVDFAHTPAALQATISALRVTHDGRILLVFGMAGGRDAANRPKMGELAATLSDFFFISTDDPMNEDPREIAAEVAAGARAAGAIQGTGFDVELDRRAAIRGVLGRAQPGDVVLLAGKGHEQRMLVAGRAEPWSDVAATLELLADLGIK